MASRTLFAVNTSERGSTKHRYILWFGDIYAKYLLVWADHLEDALDECVDCIAEKWPGLLCDDEVSNEYNRLIAEGETEEQAYEHSMVDTTCAGNNSHYLHSWQWGIVIEDPSRQDIKELLEG
jgi:hypothetical protein